MAVESLISKGIGNGKTCIASEAGKGFPGETAIADQVKGLLKVVADYSYGLEILDKYNTRELENK